MKKIFVSMLALALTTAAVAQTDHSQFETEKEWRNKDGQERKGQMEKLNLSQEQKTRMKTLSQEFKNQMQSLNQDKTLSDEAKKQKRMELMKDHRSKIEGMLTADQKKIWQENSGRKIGAANLKNDKMKGDRKKGEKGMAHKGRKAGKEEHRGKMEKDLDLTPEQSAKIKSLREDFKTSAEKIRRNTALTQQQKKEQMKELHENQMQAMKSILTTDQKAKMKNHHKERKGNSDKKITK